jgi:predicted metal-binding membrane protein
MTLLSPHAVSKSAPVSSTTVALAATLVLAAACWFLSIRLMSGMDMGVGTRLGSFGYFAAMWTPMTAAMMLPGAVPAAARDARAEGRWHAVPRFVVSYLAVWAVVGVAVFALYRPHGTVAAGAVVIAAGVYEFTPLKRYFRRRCRDERPLRTRFGLHCVGSSLGLMVMMVALGVMNVAWMIIIAIIGVAQKLLPAKTVVDVPLGLAIVGFGAAILLAPSLVPGLTPAMTSMTSMM